MNTFKSQIVKNKIIKNNKQKGSILVEFAFVVPILVIIVFGIIDLVRVNIAYGYLSDAARSTADVLSQEESVNVITFQRYHKISEAILAPLPLENIGTLYQSLSVKNDVVNSVWGSKKGSLIGNQFEASYLAKKIKENDQGIISVNIQADYRPILSFIVPIVTLKDEAYSKVRNGGVVCWESPDEMFC
jgi:Flp pilus assembly protein TadG